MSDMKVIWEICMATKMIWDKIVKDCLSAYSWAMRFLMLSQKKKISAFSWVVKNLHCSTQDSAEALNKRLTFLGAGKTGTTLKFVVLNCNTKARRKVQQLLKHQGENVHTYLHIWHVVEQGKGLREGLGNVLEEIKVGFAPRQPRAGCPRKCQKQECSPAEWETRVGTRGCLWSSSSWDVYFNLQGTFKAVTCVPSLME